jgi:hypothetical protein
MNPIINNRLKLLLVLMSTCWITASFSQELTQVVRGNVVDESNGSPVAGLIIQLQNADSEIEATSNETGHFEITVAVGRYKLVSNSTLYRIVEQEIVVISGHALNLRIVASPLTQELKGVEVTSATIQDSPGNIRSLSIEKTLRFPANFFDPVRVATAYPGVVAANDQNNSIIVRGNSPNGLLWRLNGLDMVNPNHLANAGTLSDIPSANGGGVNILSAQMLDRTDFYIGALPASYGNALSGVVDMELREGSSAEMQYTAQVSLIGIDAAAEGPVGKNSSFVANYRYSTVGLLSAIGVNLGDEEISFQDLAFNWNTHFEKGGSVSLFGILGASKNNFMAKDEWKEDKDMYNINYSSYTYAAGFNFSRPIANGEFTLGALYSSSEQSRQQIPGDNVPTNANFVISKFAPSQSILSTIIKYRTKLVPAIKLDIGIMANYLQNQYNGFTEKGLSYGYVFEDSQRGYLLQPYTQISATVKPFLTIDAGARFAHYTFNGRNSFEPRVTARLKAKPSLRVDVSYSLMSQVQQPLSYSANSELKSTKSHNGELMVTKDFGHDLTIRGSIFYQGLFDVAVSELQAAFSTLNMLEDFPDPFLANTGHGRNYGLDVTIEKMFYSKHFFLFGASYYESKYKAVDLIERDTRWNGNYTVNGTYGKEWTKKAKNRTVGVSSRILYIGGLRESSINTFYSQFYGQTYYDPVNPFTEKLHDYFRVDLRLSFRKNKPKYTRTFAIDIQNATNQQNESYHYYDFTQQKIVTKFQLGIIPVLVYRIDF